MSTSAKKPRGRLRRAARAATTAAPEVASLGSTAQSPVDIAPNDPLLAYLQSAGGAVDIDALELDSDAVRELKAAGVKLAIPLVSQGELIGVLNLGARLSEQEYSSDDRRLLDNLAGQAAPALRVGQLVREQEAEAVTRQRYEQELEVARLIQSHFLPKTLPDLPGWQIAACYQPAREVGGDFYDVIPLPDGRFGFVVGDVTDKGVPAALVMSATRSLLRASAQRLIEPGEVLERVNEQLCPDMPEKMFVTCLYGVLDPATGHLRFANAGHDLPYVKTADGVVELRARGMPLGLMPGMAYEEKEVVLAPGDSVLLHSDGVVEAHDPDRDMFGFPRLKKTVADSPSGQALIDRVLRELDEFTGPGADAGGRHHHGHAGALAGAAARRRRRAGGARRVRAPERAGQRARGDRPRRRRDRGRRPRAGAPRPAQDRGRRGDDERDGARQQVRRRPARRDPGARGRRRRARPGDRPRRRGRARRCPRRPTSRPSSTAARAHAAGACS